MTEFMRPQVSVDKIDERTARYVVEPLERGFGYTLGNCMRRVLLSSLQGAAATSIRIEGVQHEFSAIEGVREDVTDIVLNVKGLVFRGNETGEDAIATLSASGPGVVTGADLKVPSEFELVNPEQPIATLNKGAKLEMSMRVGVGRGYVSADRNKRADDPLGVITVDSLFSPVSRCTYVVENTRVGQRTDYDKLILEVETNGAVDPSDAVARSAQIIDEHMMLFRDQAVTALSDEATIFAAQADEGDSLLDTPIEELDLSVRSYNCLKRQGVNTIGQLTECTEGDLLNIRNFGAKSIEEVKDKLQQMGLGLKDGDRPRPMVPVASPFEQPFGQPVTAIQQGLPSLDELSIDARVADKLAGAGVGDTATLVAMSEADLAEAGLGDSDIQNIKDALERQGQRLKQ